MKRPSRVGAKLPTSVWKSSDCVCAPLAGSKRSSRRAGMSQYQSTCCCGCQTGLSPSQRGLVDGDANLGRAHLRATPTSSRIQASSIAPGASATRPCAAGSAMWMALLTWLTGSTQK